MMKKGFSLIPASVKEWFINSIEYPTDIAVKFNIHPNFFTILGLLSSIIGAFFYGIGNLLFGGVFIFIGGISDTFDGKIARKTGQSSKFGAIFDSSLDRYSEFLMFFGIMIYFLSLNDKVTFMATFSALAGSVMVSYVRARAEGAGFECNVGVMQRAERVVLIGLASIVAAFTQDMVLIGAIWSVAVLANVTAFQRIHHVWKNDSK